jgi:hypothetical protein
MTIPSDPPTPYIARKGIPYGPEYQQQIAAFVGVPRREWKLVYQNIYLTPRWQHFKLTDGRAVRITHGMLADTSRSSRVTRRCVITSAAATGCCPTPKPNVAERKMKV